MHPMTIDRRLLPLLLLLVAGIIFQAPGALAQVSVGSTYQLSNQTINNGLGMSAGTRFQVFACLSPESEAGGISTGTSYRVEAGCPFAQAQGLPADDDDGDGVSNGVEDAAPNNGDGNNDGIADSTQSTVTSLPSATGAGYLTVVITGGTCSPLTNVATYTEESLGDDPLFIYPLGLIGFKIPCTVAGGSATVKVLFHGTANLIFTPTDYRKYGPMAPLFGAPQFYTLPGVVFGSETIPSEGTLVTATFTLTDGQLGDDTPVDSMILDQGGPAVRFRAAAPAMSPLGLLLLTLSILAVAWLGLRRRPFPN